MTTWLDRWPPWAGRRYGWLGRCLIGISGILLGAFLVLVATFGVSYERDMPAWGAKEIVFLCFVLVIIGTSLWVVALPSRTSLTVFLIVVVGSLLTGTAI